ncbi:sigma-70 family RNA polymerase sigma factor [Enterococcus sp. BWB1-3]|uniref:sigma-70 family RNA polymerase sigma factor n=1 Tax=unclassified Enterococcus TaxID=2608891 RepID=UPI0019245FA7|nr:MULTISPECIES: sigma-70 family RNA polymerase sigma factor [unclassified Enterococcus]MBL1228662.1 sigma-70 family RNA polymerase sigma factor [Enterococcus sp. BWB1-3]MCB5953648.1 sigma-70 family RNA polymerase sigma factor [Enterococcus sp. CWB-B31]
MKKVSVEEAVNGSQEALELLLKEHYQQLYKTAFLYVKNEPDALDIVQDAVIKIINKISCLQFPEYFTTWAVRIVIYTALDHLKKNKAYTDEVDEQIADPEKNLSKEEQLDIYDGIRRLPQHLQEVTILHYFYGRKLKEISLVLNEPLGTTKYKLHEARMQLKKYLEEGE